MHPGLRSIYAEMDEMASQLDLRPSMGGFEGWRGPYSMAP